MSTQPGINASHKHQIFADYHQIWLEDNQAQEGASEAPSQRAAASDALVAQLLSEEARERYVGAASGILCLLTARAMPVPVEVEILAEAPPADFVGWDRVVEASLELPSGVLVIHGPTDYFPEAPRLTLAPGTYRVRAYFGGLTTVSPDELEGDDHYRVTLWPAASAEPVVLFAKEGDALQGRKMSE